MAAFLNGSNPPSGLVLIEDSACHPNWPLLKCLKDVKIIRCSDPIPSGLVLVEDFTEALMTDPAQLTPLYQKIKGHVGTFYLPLQTDVLPPSLVMDCEYLVDTVIRVKQLGPTGLLLETRERKSGAKLAVNLLQGDIDGQGQAINFRPHTEPTITGSESRAASQDPAATFNLGLTADQKIQKDSLVLPHMRQLSINEPVGAPPKQAILASDFDDEDPDDDLDI